MDGYNKLAEFSESIVNLYKICNELISNKRTDCNDRVCGECSVCRAKRILIEANALFNLEILKERNNEYFPVS
jgi:hypothetical protein